MATCLRPFLVGLTKTKRVDAYALIMTRQAVINRQPIWHRKTFSGIRLRSKTCLTSALGSVDGSDERTIKDLDRLEQPPHHTEEVPDIPGNPARALSDTLIVVNVIIFIIQLLNPNVTLLGIESNTLINQGQWWRFITPAFLHGSPQHLLVNMLSLHSLGPITEWTSGRERFIAIYLFAAFTGNLASYFGDDLPSLGASGAIFGLAGALFIYFRRNRPLFGSRFDGLLMRLVLIIILNLGTGFILPQIDEYGHVGGLLGGALAAYVLGPRYELCKIKGQSGAWLIDEPPLHTMATPPRKVVE